MLFRKFRIERLDRQVYKLHGQILVELAELQFTGRQTSARYVALCERLERIQAKLRKFELDSPA
ncbi:hypothetical protein [Ottowia sp. VDI28]|uniref:hypothetical protein n=1 Tax=Ottowia sp. VDI28 TaxID=3133968 RepID=UPI003C300DC5